MTDIEMQMIRALAAIDEALDLPADGCNSTARTLDAIRNLRAPTLPDCRTCAYIVKHEFYENSPCCALDDQCKAGELHDPAHSAEPVRLYQREWGT